jgi:hypothetical protein
MVTGGVTTEGGRIVVDVDEVYRDHEVNDDDPNCRACGVEYPCELVVAVDQLTDWLKGQDKTTVPCGAGSEKE